MGLFGRKKKESTVKLSLPEFMSWLDEGLTDEQRGNMLLNMAFSPEKKIRESFGSYLSDADFKRFMGMLKDMKKSVEDNPMTKKIRELINDD